MAHGGEFGGGAADFRLAGEKNERVAFVFAHGVQHDRGGVRFDGSAGFSGA